MRIWDTTGEVVHTLTGDTDSVRAVAFHPHGRHLAIAGDGATVRIWDTSTGQLRHTLIGHSGAVRAVAYPPDGAHLATAGDDATVRIWDVTTGQVLHTLTDHTNWVQALAYHPYGTDLATAGNDATVRLWEVSAKMPLARTFHMLPDGEAAAFDAATGALLHATPGAWRWLGWNVVQDGHITRLPAETFGELP